jgi:hypothetical protein
MQLQTIPLEFLIIAMLALASMAVPVCALLIQPERLNEPLDRVFMGQAAAWLLALAVMGFGLGLTKDDNYSVTCYMPLLRVFYCLAQICRTLYSVSGCRCTPCSAS